MIEIIKIIWRPVIEIIILTVVIYYLIGFLRRTRGLPIVIGFVILLILTIFTTLFEFQVLAWLLQAFFAISAFAIVVILQPELRRLLAEIGSIPMIANTHEQRQSIEEIIKAVENMSASRIAHFRQLVFE